LGLAIEYTSIVSGALERLLAFQTPVSAEYTTVILSSKDSKSASSSSAQQPFVTMAAMVLLPTLTVRCAVHECPQWAAVSTGQRGTFQNSLTCAWLPLVRIEAKGSLLPHFDSPEFVLHSVSSFGPDICDDVERGPLPTTPDVSLRSGQFAEHQSPAGSPPQQPPSPHTETTAGPPSVRCSASSRCSGPAFLRN